MSARPEHLQAHRGLGAGERVPVIGSWVVGCGSALVEHVQVVTSTPTLGETVYLADPSQPRSESTASGTMLTLLSWAASLHVPTALLGLQGADASGKMVSQAMQKHGVSDAWVVVSPDFVTAENHVFAVNGDLGKTSTLSATGCTSLIDSPRMRKHFVPSLRTAGVCIAEIGAVPCGAVATLLQEARTKKLLSLLCVDMLPTTAIGDSNLGSLEELQACITQADVLMQPRHVAEQLLFMTSDDGISYEDTLAMPTTELASLLRASTGADLVAIVEGGALALEGCVLATLGASVHVPPMGAALEARNQAVAAATEEPLKDRMGMTEKLRADASVLPTQPLLHGAGVTHAFYGGLLAALYHAGGIPTEEPAIYQAGSMANAAASACLRNLYALPDMENEAVVAELKGDVTIKAVLDAVTTAKTKLDKAETKAAKDKTNNSVTQKDTFVEMAAYRGSYETDAAWSERLARISGAHGRGGDATRAASIVACLLGCEAMGGTIMVAAEQQDAGVARRLALSLAACGFRAQFVAAGEGSIWPHGWAHNARSNDALICISHDGSGGSGSLAESVATLRTVHGLPTDSRVVVAEEDPKSEEEDDALEVAELENDGLDGLLVTSRRLKVISILAGADDMGTDRNSPLQSLSDHVISYPVDDDEFRAVPLTRSDVAFGENQAEAMRAQAETVVVGSSRVIAQQMVANAVVAELVHRVNKITEDESD